MRQHSHSGGWLLAVDPALEAGTWASAAQAVMVMAVGTVAFARWVLRHTIALT